MIRHLQHSGEMKKTEAGKEHSRGHATCLGKIIFRKVFYSGDA